MTSATRNTLIVLGIILLVVGYFAFQAIMHPATVTNESPAAAAFAHSSSTDTFTDFSGNPANLDQHLGTVIVAHAWASWVPTSPQSLQDLQRLQTEFETQSVTVLAINRGEPLRTARSFLDSLNITTLRLIADDDDQYFTNVGGRTMPETIFYDQNGEIVHHARTMLTMPELRMYTRQAIAATEGNNETLDNIEFP